MNSFDGGRYFTSDGVQIEPGLRVFTNNARWGTVTDDRAGAYDGWFNVDEDDKGKTLLNGERMSTRLPRGW